MELTASFVDLLQHFAPVFTAPTFQTFSADRHGLDPFPSAPLYDGGHLRRRQRRQRALVPVPSLLQPCRLGPGHLVPVPGQIGLSPSWPRCHLALGRRRYPLPQTRTDSLRRRHALRSADLQPRQVPGQLGTRLGRALPDHRQAVLGTHQSLCLADRRAAVPQSPRTHQGEEEPEAKPPSPIDRIIALDRNWPSN